MNEWNKLFNTAADHFSLQLHCVTSAPCLFEQNSSCSCCISGWLPSRCWVLFSNFLFCFKQAQDAVLVKMLSMVYRLFGTNWRSFFVLVEVRGLMFQLRLHNPWYRENLSVFLLHGHNPVTMEGIRGTSLPAQRFGNGTLATRLCQLSWPFLPWCFESK